MTPPSGARWAGQAGNGQTGIEPGYAWFGHNYRPVWRVFIGGRQVGVWTKRRWARRNLRQQLRAARRAGARP